MKSWKAWLAAAVAGTGFLVWTVTAQPPARRPNGPPPPDRLERAIDKMELSKKDREQAEKALQAHHDEVRKLHDAGREELLKELKGVLTAKQYEQLKEALQRRPPPPPAGPGVSVDALVERLMRFDKNKDGKLTKDELPGRMHHLFALGDTNKDGALDREEIKKLAERLNQGARPRSAGPPPRPGGLERAVEDLALGRKEKEKAEKILLAHHDEVRKQADKARDELFEELKDILTVRQFERLKGAMERRPPPPPRPE